MQKIAKKKCFDPSGPVYFLIDNLEPKGSLISFKLFL